ncbi:MAG: sigma-70 family RNA polymerase sigma factor [Bryobacteraceae bacterium]|nr:sigma-70 family RNA polymerase sigma factor [Bryobacteraceae bacterium]
MAFPSTRISILELARQESGERQRAALDELIAVYWKPVYQYVRLKWRRDPDEAADLTQGFFASLLERRLLDRFDPAQASFHTYLRLCVDGHAGHEYEAAHRLKRGGAHHLLSLDFPGAERELASLASSTQSIEDLFHREWQRQMFSLAVADLRTLSAAQDKNIQFAIFEAYDLAAGDRPTYAALARAHSIPETQVTNYLAWARRELRRLLLERLERISASEKEFRDDARGLLGE